MIAIGFSGAPTAPVADAPLKPRFGALWRLSLLGALGLVGLFGPIGDRIVGLFAVLVAVSVLIPFPGTNSPPSIALVIASIAVMEEDGYLLLAAYLIGALGHGPVDAAGPAIGVEGEVLAFATAEPEVAVLSPAGTVTDSGTV